MKVAKQIDNDIGNDLNTTVCDIPMVLKHVNKLSRIVTGFVFAFHKDGLTYYDTVEVIRETNGCRIRIPKLAITKTVHQRIHAHLYQRWYVQCGEQLYPLQMVKPAVLDDSFYFVVSDNPHYRTQTAFTEETLFIRKKALVACRPFKTGWGVLLPPRIRKTA